MHNVIVILGNVIVSEKLLLVLPWLATFFIFNKIICQICVYIMLQKSKGHFSCCPRAYHLLHNKTEIAVLCSQRDQRPVLLSLNTGEHRTDT